MKKSNAHTTVVKKTHSVKNDLLCDDNQRIIWLSLTHEGHIHDKKIVDEQPLALPTGIVLWQDTGFQGHIPDNVIIQMPTKKPRGKELTDSQKKENKRISSFRILSNMLSAMSKTGRRYFILT